MNGSMRICRSYCLYYLQRIFTAHLYLCLWAGASLFGFQWRSFCSGFSGLWAGVEELSVITFFSTFSLVYLGFQGCFVVCFSIAGSFFLCYTDYWFSKGLVFFPCISVCLNGVCVIFRGWFLSLGVVFIWLHV